MNDAIFNAHYYKRKRSASPWLCCWQCIEFNIISFKPFIFRINIINLEHQGKALCFKLLFLPIPPDLNVLFRFQGASCSIIPEKPHDSGSRQGASYLISIPTKRSGPRSTTWQSRERRTLTARRPPRKRALIKLIRKNFPLKKRKQKRKLRRKMLKRLRLKLSLNPRMKLRLSLLLCFRFLNMLKPLWFP